MITPVLLKPGQQAVLDTLGLVVHEADTEQEIAWKNGVFLLPWFYLNQHSRIALQGDTLLYSEGIKAFNQKGHRLIKQGELMLRDNNDLFVPALWIQTNFVKRWKNKIVCRKEPSHLYCSFSVKNRAR